MGFEPTTSTLARLRSTTELHPRSLFHVCRGSGAIILICAQYASLFLLKNKKSDFCLFCGLYLVK